jgi:hypothetical protein
MTTLGEDRVRTKFNPSADTTVDQIKQKSAELIDLVEEIKLVAQKNGAQSETIRLCALAQTHYEDAAMWAVKAATTGK